MKNNGDWRKELRKREFRVSIFGSARIKRNDAVYHEIYKMGKKLGERHIDIVTGGGPGLMEAASYGHKVGRKGHKAHAIALNIKLPVEQKFNVYSDIKMKFKRFSKRLDNFMLLSNAVVVAPGGVGTLLELLYTWQLVQVKHIKHIPIILLGDMWPDLLKWLEKEPLKRKYFEKEDLDLLFLAKDADEVIKIIDAAHLEFKKGKKSSVNVIRRKKRH